MLLLLVLLLLVLLLLLLFFFFFFWQRRLLVAIAAEFSDQLQATRLVQLQRPLQLAGDQTLLFFRPAKKIRDKPLVQLPFLYREGGPWTPRSPPYEVSVGRYNQVYKGYHRASTI